MGHSLPMHLTLVPINVRFTPNSRHSSVATRWPLCARSAARPGNHRLGRASLMTRAIAPLPCQCSPFSSSRAKQLGWRSSTAVEGVVSGFAGLYPPAFSI